MEGNYTLDHIIPLSKNGPHALYNIQLAHHHCNTMKNNKYGEAEILKTIMQWLTLKRFFFFRNNVGAMKTARGFIRFGIPGSPDIILVIKGQFIGIEVKSGKGEQSIRQKEFQTALEHAGGRYILARSIQDVEKSLRP